MRHFRRSTDMANSASVFYYTAMTALFVAFVVALKWQLEPDTAEVVFNETSFVSTPENRGFYVPVYFCHDKKTDITLERYYREINTRIIYAVPDGRYKTGDNNCFDAMVNANTGRLEPGQYEYHVSVSYDLNPLRTIHKPVALVRVTVE